MASSMPEPSSSFPSVSEVNACAACMIRQKRLRCKVSERGTKCKDCKFHPTWVTGHVLCHFCLATKPTLCIVCRKPKGRVIRIDFRLFNFAGIGRYFDRAVASLPPEPRAQAKAYRRRVYATFQGEQYIFYRNGIIAAEIKRLGGDLDALERAAFIRHGC